MNFSKNKIIRQEIVFSRNFRMGGEDGKISALPFPGTIRKKDGAAEAEEREKQHFSDESLMPMEQKGN